MLRCSSRYSPPNRKFHLWEVFEHLCSEYFLSPFSSHDASVAVPSLLRIPNPWAEAQDYGTSLQTHGTSPPDQKAEMLSKEWTPKHFLSKKVKLRCNLSFQLTFFTTMMPGLMHEPQPGPTACPETPPKLIIHCSRPRLHSLPVLSLWVGAVAARKDWTPVTHKNLVLKWPPSPVTPQLHNPVTPSAPPSPATQLERGWTQAKAAKEPTTALILPEKKLTPLLGHHEPLLDDYLWHRSMQNCILQKP